MKPERKQLKFGLVASGLVAMGVCIACSPGQSQAAQERSVDMSTLPSDTRPTSQTPLVRVPIPKQLPAAKPRTLSMLLQTAKPGQVIHLPSGNAGSVNLKDRSFKPAVTVYVGAATISEIMLRNVTGVHFIGGRIVGPGADQNQYRAVYIDRSKDIAIKNMDISKSQRGIVMNMSDGILIEGNNLHDLRADGIDVALSRNVVVRGNRCSNFYPIPPIYDANGKMLKDGDHPDCIQGWTRPMPVPSANILVEGNQADGDMQGIFFGSAVRNGVDDGGYDNVVIRNNRVNISLYHGATIEDGRNSIIRDNIVDTIPGSRNAARPEKLVKAFILLKGGSGSRACGNRVSAYTNHSSEKPC